MFRYPVAGPSLLKSRSDVLTHGRLEMNKMKAVFSVQMLLVGTLWRLDLSNEIAEVTIEL